MEKKEAVREWCIEKAMVIIASQSGQTIHKVEDVIKLAKELETYITK